MELYPSVLANLVSHVCDGTSSWMQGGVAACDFFSGCGPDNEEMSEKTDSHLRVLVIDDVRPVIRVLELELRLYGYEVVSAEISSQVLEVIEEITPDVIIFEIFMPQIPGMELLRAIRERTSIPVILLTTSSNEADKEEALNLGASDYILKPFEPEDLTYRISSLLKAPRPPVKVITAGDLRIDFGRRLVTRDGKGIPISTSEWAIIFSLGRRLREYVRPDDILLQVWGLEGLVNKETLPGWMEKIREKLGNGGTKDIIEGNNEKGYRLNAEW
jgi:two-component system, OmpR family, KDP operon response regulator KdpE